ncbi:MAG: murein biosynthesis integral membrane protein MurJ [Deltaproteobacteria bacterium]|nr:murein biosynthesis integral membrane protein MurJ [Deltaproteobacteria bacterium]
MSATRAPSSVASKIGRATAILMASVLLSRILGFVRESVIAGVMGANARTDVYYAAFTIPDFLNHLVAGGALSITFIPIFSRLSTEGRESDGWRVCSTILSTLVLVLGTLTVAAEFFADPLARLVTRDFTPAQFDELARLTRILLPAQLFFVVGGILMAVQFAKDSFLGPALAPLVYNLGIIVGGAALGPLIGMEGFAWGALVGSFAGNFVIQLVFARKVGFVFTRRIDLRDVAFREFLLLSIPLALGLSLTLADDWVTRWMASSVGPAAITILAYARTLMRIPLAVVGQTTGSASFPLLSRLYAAGRLPEFRAALSRAMRQVLVLMLPATALTIACSREITFIVYCRGKFTLDDTIQTANVLVCYAGGLAAWGIHTVISRGFYAMRDTVTPTWVGTLALFASLPVYWLLMNAFSERGLAVASSVGITIYATLLYVLFERRTRSEAWRGEVQLLVALAGLATVAGFGALGATSLLDNVLPWTSIAGSLVRLTLGTIVAAGLYVGSAILFKVTDVVDIASAVFRHRS